MDKQLKEKWIAALRSGKYEQGKYYLNANESFYCCLGVLCEVANLNKEQTGRGIAYFQKIQFIDNGFLPLDFQLETAKISTEQQKTLQRMNDTQGKSFAEIANYIEENL